MYMYQQLYLYRDMYMLHGDIYMLYGDIYMLYGDIYMLHGDIYMLYGGMYMLYRKKDETYSSLSAMSLYIITTMWSSGTP